jgi:hypothetical protein
MEGALSALVFFDPRGSIAPQRESSSEVEREPRLDRRLFCARCRHPVTHQDERIEVAGGHRHTRTNPAGFTFTFGCFREAGGCIAVGAATREHTWFAGYAWRIALCASCERHLGWRFEAPGDRFHGLILERLASAGGALR